MKRDFLKELGLEEEAINKIMAENGKDIEKAKGDSEKLNTELEQTKADLQKANETMEKFKDYEQTKADVEKYKSELEKSKADFELKLQNMEQDGKVKDFISSLEKKFVNEETKSFYMGELKNALGKEENKNKNFNDIFTALTEGKENIFEKEFNAPVPPKVTQFANGDTGKTSDNASKGKSFAMPWNRFK